MLKRDNIWSIVFKMIGLVLGSSVIALLFLWLVYLLPTESMAKNMQASAETLYSQNDTQFLLDAEFWKVYDRGTNIIMLYEVIYPNTGQALEDALLSPTYDYLSYWGKDWAEVLMEYASDTSASTDYVPYARYWHGYLVFLKPLFMFMDLQGIYIINAIVLLIMTAVITWLFRKRLGNYWIAYVVTIAMMHPVNIVQSFQLSTVFYAMQITLLIMLSAKKLTREKILYLFALDGILVAFLDFLTYPYVALAVPLLTYYLLNDKDDLKDNIITAIWNSVSFAVGYVGMWGMKWVYATIFTEENVIMEAINSVLQRTGVVESENDVYFVDVSVKNAISGNLASFFNIQNIIILILVLFVLGIVILITKRQPQFHLNTTIVCLLMLITPFAWVALLSNHCSLHPHLEWRTFAVFIYAIMIWIIGVWFSKDKYKREDSKMRK